MGGGFLLGSAQRPTAVDTFEGNVFSKSVNFYRNFSAFEVPRGIIQGSPVLGLNFWDLVHRVDPTLQPQLYIVTQSLLQCPKRLSVLVLPICTAPLG